jgi:poly(3-hydroxybutyrate) depolymerase
LFHTSESAVTLRLSALFVVFLAPCLFAAPEAGKSAEAVKALADALGSQQASLADLADKDFAKVPLTKAAAATARTLLWKAHEDLIRKDRSAELKDRLLKDGKLEMPFFYKTFGDKPKARRSLWISLHGGGGAPKEVNDRQYENQKKLYTVDEGIYLAPRAPTNTWNLWHEPHIDRLFGRLIEDLVVLEEVNPDRVYLLGYSAGGDGVYQLAPRMADCWAGAAMMAGHPNGVSLLSLRNVPFALQVGANDAAYNRNKVAQEYGERLDKLQSEDKKGYPHYVKIHEGKGHWMGLEDRAALPWMAKFNRDPVPEKVVWKQTGTPHDRSYWLAVPPGEAKNDTLVIVQRTGQKVEVTSAEKVGKLLIRLDDRMADLDKQVTVTHAGKELFAGTPARTIGVLLKTLVGRGDPKLIFDAEVSVEIPTK